MKFGAYNIMDDCVFCKIIKGDIPSPRIYEDEYVIAIDDVNPVAKVHALIIPKTHYRDILELAGDEAGQRAAIAVNHALCEVARIKGVAASGFRVLTNCGADSGQTVWHLHYHLLGGQSLGPRLL